MHQIIIWKPPYYRCVDYYYSHLSYVEPDDVIEPEKDLVMKHVRSELLNLTALIPVLNKHNLLTLDDNYVLLNYMVTPLERTNVLLYKILPSKGPGAYKTFITCLQEEAEHIGHQELAKIFTTSLTKSEH